MALFRIDPFPSDPERDKFWRRAWDAPLERSYENILARSLGHMRASG